MSRAGDESSVSSPPAATVAPGRVDRIAAPGPGPRRSVEDLRAELAAEVGDAITRAELLVVDEVGLEQVERNEARRSGLMQKVLLPRYNQQLSTVITSNIPWESWGDYLGDHLGATALVDRLLHHSHVIVINGPSYRDWEHKQDVGTPRSPTAVATETATPVVQSAGRATSGGARRRGK